MKVISFILDNELYGLNIKDIGEILIVPTIERVPNTSFFVEGVINLRGNIVPVVNLSKKFGLKNKNLDINSKIVVIKFEEEAVGILVDEVREAIKIESESEIEKTPEIKTEIPSKVFLGVFNYNDKMLIILDAKEILHVEEQ